MRKNYTQVLVCCTSACRANVMQYNHDKNKSKMSMNLWRRSIGYSEFQATPFFPYDYCILSQGKPQNLPNGRYKFVNSCHGYILALNYIKREETVVHSFF